MSVIFSASPPDRFISHIWLGSPSPPRFARKETYLPSGLHLALLSLALLKVNCKFFVPSQLTIHKSLPRLSSFASVVRTVYTTQFPSGEILGSATSRNANRSSS